MAPTALLIMAVCVSVFVSPTASQACVSLNLIDCTCPTTNEVICNGTNVCPSEIDASVVTLRLSLCHCGTTIEQSDFSKFTNLKVLELNECDYTSIGDHAFGDMRLTELTITRSLQTLSPNSFSGLPDPHMSLALDHNNLTTIPTGTFANLNIGTLDISFNPLTTVEAGAFAGSTIGNLTLKNTNLTSLPEEDSAVLTTLSKLDLGGVTDWQCDCGSLWLIKFFNGSDSSVSPTCSASNKDTKSSLTEIEARCLTTTTTTTESRPACPSSCTCLTLTDVSCDRTNVCPSDIDASVKDLSLSSCQCGTTIERSTFSKFTKLSTLKLYGCSYISIGDHAFDGMWLTRLTITRSLQTLSPNSFSGLRDPHVSLDLARNNLTTIQPGTFANLNIAMLDISFNPLTTVEAGAFTGSNITNVILKNTQLTTIQPDTFSNTQITTLDLSSSPLKTVEAGAFTGSTITNVILKNTQVTTIQPDTFSNTQITTLDLSSSPLKTVEAGAFIGNTIVTLLLKDTQLTTLPEADSAVLARLTTLDLSGNEWECECPSLWLAKFLANSSGSRSRSPSCPDSTTDLGHSVTNIEAKCLATTTTTTESTTASTDTPATSPPTESTHASNDDTASNGDNAVKLVLTIASAAGVFVVIGGATQVIYLIKTSKRTSTQVSPTPSNKSSSETTAEKSSSKTNLTNQTEPDTYINPLLFV